MKKKQKQNQKKIENYPLNEETLTEEAKVLILQEELINLFLLERLVLISQKKYQEN